METNYLVCSRWIKVEVGGDRRVEDLVEEEFELIERRFLVGGDSWRGREGTSGAETQTP